MNTLKRKIFPIATILILMVLGTNISSSESINSTTSEERIDPKNATGITPDVPGWVEESTAPYAYIEPIGTEYLGYRFRDYSQDYKAGIINNHEIRQKGSFLANYVRDRNPGVESAPFHFIFKCNGIMNFQVYLGEEKIIHSPFGEAGITYIPVVDGEQYNIKISWDMSSGTGLWDIVVQSSTQTFSVFDKPGQFAGDGIDSIQLCTGTFQSGFTVSLTFIDSDGDLLNDVYEQENILGSKLLNSWDFVENDDPFRDWTKIQGSGCVTGSGAWPNANTAILWDHGTGSAGMYTNFESTTRGSTTFDIKSTEVAKLTYILLRQGSTNAIIMAIWQNGLYNHDGESWNKIRTLVSNTWYREVEVSWNTVSDTFSVTCDGGTYADKSFYSNVDEISRLHFETYNGFYPYDTYIDNVEIWKYNTNPNTADTDEDYLSDWKEIHEYSTNPLEDSDKDGDGLTDSEEIFIYMTDLANVDSDGDSFRDGDEVLDFKSSPLDSNFPISGNFESENSLTEWTCGGLSSTRTIERVASPFEERLGHMIKLYDGSTGLLGGKVSMKRSIPTHSGDFLITFEIATNFQSSSSLDGFQVEISKYSILTGRRGYTFNFHQNTIFLTSSSISMYPPVSQEIGTFSINELVRIDFLLSSQEVQAWVNGENGVLDQNMPVPGEMWDFAFSDMQIEVESEFNNYSPMSIWFDNYKAQTCVEVIDECIVPMQTVPVFLYRIYAPPINDPNFEVTIYTSQTQTYEWGVKLSGYTGISYFATGLRAEYEHLNEQTITQGIGFTISGGMQDHIVYMKYRGEILQSGFRFSDSDYVHCSTSIDLNRDSNTAIGIFCDNLDDFYTGWTEPYGIVARDPRIEYPSTPTSSVPNGGSGGVSYIVDTTIGNFVSDKIGAGYNLKGALSGGFSIQGTLTWTTTNTLYRKITWEHSDYSIVTSTYFDDPEYNLMPWYNIEIGN